MLALRKEKRSPYWYVRGTIAGVRIYESTGTTDRKAAEGFRRVREERLYQELVLGKRPAATFAQAVNAYLDSGRAPKFLLPLVRRWGDLPLSDITQTLVDRLAAELYDNPASRRRAVYVPTSAVLNYAELIGLWDGGRRLQKPRSPQKPAQWATDEHIAKVLAKCSPGVRAVLRVMTYTGLRTTEALTRTADDFMARPGWVVVEKTKNGEPAFAPVPPDVLQECIEVGFRWGVSSSKSLCRAVRLASQRAGVPYIKPHGLGRHAFAARLLAAGYDIKLVKEAGRWKTLGIVDATYGHLEERHVHNAMRKVAENKRTA